jgi:hypothetical protein
MILTLTVEILEDLNGILKCVFECMKIVYFISRVPVDQKL